MLRGLELLTDHSSTNTKNYTITECSLTFYSKLESCNKKNLQSLGYHMLQEAAIEIKAEALSSCIFKISTN